MLLVRAAENLKAEALAKAIKEAAFGPKDDPWSPNFKPTTKVVSGKAAEAIADKPKLTGNKEWDAVELAETDAMREPYNSEFLGKFLHGVKSTNDGD